MPLDYSIPLQQTQVQAPNVMGMYANALALQNAQRQNQVGALQYQNALREQADAEATRQVLMESGGDPKRTINALYSRGLYKQAQALEEQQLKRREQLSKIDKDELETQLKRAGVLSSSLAPLVEKGENITHDDVFAVGKRLEQMGILKEGWAAPIPMNAAQLPAFVKQMALSTDGGRQALERLKAEIEYLDTGGSKTPVNKNPLAGPVGPVAGAQSVQKTMTPGEKAADERAREQAEQGKKQVVTDAQGNIQIVNKDIGIATPAKDASGKQIRGKQSLTESQGKATGFSMRAIEAQNLLNDLESKGTYGRITGAKEGLRGALERVPVVGTALGNAAAGAANFVTSDPQQKYEQAARDFINAVLRVESGATITPQEFDNAYRQYFPQAGDGKAVIEQKRKNRETAIEALRAQTGPGADKLPNDVSKLSDAELKKRLGL